MLHMYINWFVQLRHGQRLHFRKVLGSLLSVYCEPLTCTLWYLKKGVWSSKLVLPSINNNTFCCSCTTSFTLSTNTGNSFLSKSTLRLSRAFTRVGSEDLWWTSKTTVLPDSAQHRVVNNVNLVVHEPLENLSVSAELGILKLCHL